MNKSTLWSLLWMLALALVLTPGCMWDGEDAGVEEVEVTVEAEEPGSPPAFDSAQWNAAIGLGGGAGSKWGSRRGGIRGLALNPRMDTSGESYSKVKENAFKLVSASPLSTFGVDVDTASYTNIRRYLNYGRLPPAAAVRVEEMINYFKFDYPKPQGRDSFSVSLEQGACPWNTDHQLVLVGLQGREIPPDQIPPRNLVFLIDVSGSMSAADKLPLVTRSLKLMLKKLTDKDTVAVVTYAGQDRVALEPTSCADISTIEHCLDNLTSSGGTNGAGGIQKSYQLAQAHFAKEHINRVILVTDGDFNVGVTKQEDLKKMIEQQRESGVFLTVIGVGTGNLGDARMSMLAKHGNGQYIYVDGDKEARRQLDERLEGTLVTIAKDVKLQVEFNPGKVAGYRLIGYERRVMKASEFRDDKKDSGEVGAGHSVTALYEVVPVGKSVPGADVAAAVDAQVSTAAAKDGHLMDVRLRYKAPWSERAKESSYRLAHQPTSHFPPSLPLDDPRTARLRKATRNVDFAGAVALFGMVLAGSEHLGQATLELAKEWATPLSKGSSAREELLQLLGKAIGLREVRDEAARAAGKALDEDSPAGKDAGEDAASRARNRQEREVAVSAVHFLVAQQKGDGSFQPAGDCPVSSVGLTSLVVLAVLGEGSNTLRRGPHRGVIKQAIIWLRSQQTEDGQFSAGAKGQAGALDHVLATIAMCETHHRSAYRTLKVNAERGRDYLVAHLEPGVELRTWYWLADQAFKSARLKRIDGALQKHDWRGPAAPEIQQIVGVVDMLLAPVPAANSTARQVRGVGKHVEMAKAVLTQGGPALMTCYQAGTAMHAIGGQLAVKWRDTLRNRLSGCQQKSGRFKAARQGTDPVYAAALLTMCVTAAHDGRLGR